MYKAIQQANTNLQILHSDLKTLISGQAYTNHALNHISKQDDTIICILENISRHTCELLDEAHSQTTLQKSMKEKISTLLELYKFVHPDAVLEFERLENLRKKISECCPPAQPAPFCVYEACEAPPPLDDPSPGEPPIG